MIEETQSQSQSQSQTQSSEETSEESQEATPDEDSPQSLMTELLVLQGELADDGTTVKALSSHLRLKLYPWLVKNVELSRSIGETVQDVVDNLPQDEGGGITQEDGEFFMQCSVALKEFITKWWEQAKQWQAQGNGAFFEEISALFAMANGMEQVAQSYLDEYESTEVENVG